MINDREKNAVVLPNGTTLDTIYGGDENWELTTHIDHVKQYIRNGITLKDNSTVLDVGGNIGLFGIYLYDLFHGYVEVHSFEPIKGTYEQIAKNYKDLNSEKMKCYNFGLSDVDKKLTFTHFPNAPGLSTYKPEYMNISDVMEEINHKDMAIPEFFNHREEEIQAKNPERFKKLHMMLGLKTMFQEVSVECDVFSLDSFLEEHREISTIDLLKVDVNGSEVDIFNGISGKNWDKVRQIVFETPRNEDEIQDITKIFHDAGFLNVVINRQKPILNKGMNYTLVYALRE